MHKLVAAAHTINVCLWTLCVKANQALMYNILCLKVSDNYFHQVWQEIMSQPLNGNISTLSQFLNMQNVLCSNKNRKNSNL